MTHTSPPEHPLQPSRTAVVATGLAQDQSGARREAGEAIAAEMAFTLRHA